MPIRATDETIRRELEELAAIVAAHPEGITGPEILAAFNGAHPDDRPLRSYTMLRRLAVLETERRLVPEGGGRWRRYRPLTTTELASAGEIPSAPGPDRPDGAPATREGSDRLSAERPTESPAEPSDAPRTHDDAREAIALTPAGDEVRALVRRPLAEKPAVILYDEGFIRAYQPGTTYYVPDTLRAALHEAGRTPVADRPAGTYARHIFERLLIDLSFNSSRLEGNQYSRLDTKNLIEKNVRAPGKSSKDAQMILNHRKAIELLVDQAEEIGYNRYTFCNLHAALSENLLANPADEGRLRRHPVGIEGTPFQPLDVPQKIEEIFDHLLSTVAEIPDPFEQAFFLMVHVPYLQPFADVNKRTSRLAANLPLIKANLTPLSFVGMVEDEYVEGTLGVYEERRIEMLRDVFAEVYHRSCDRYQAVRRDMAEPDPVRLKYRQQLYDLVYDIVSAPRNPDAAAIAAWAAEHDIPASETERFVEIARELLDGLHEGSISRYRLRPSQFHAWRRVITDGPL